MKIDWLIPFFGIAVVAGSLLAATTYLGLERRVHAAEALGTTLDRLSQDLKVSAVLKTIHDGEVNAAAERLDLLLCENILRLNAELASADTRTRAYVEDAFRRIALLRPRAVAGISGGTAREFSDDQTAAERILTQALGGDHIAQTK